jgi:cytochrome c2
MFQRVLVISFAVILLAAACGGGQPASSAGNAANGEKLFQQATLGKDNVPGCSSCHAVQPDKVLVGPSLAGIATDAAGAFKEAEYKGKAKSAEEWLREAIVDPNAEVAAGFQPGVMPQNFKSELSDQQTNDLVAYLMTLK